jgi:hypothetical protein
MDRDLPVTAHKVVEIAIEAKLDRSPLEEECAVVKNPHAVALGRLGGIKGGKARAESLSKEQRREIAISAARARWRRK